jgi:hypothetical protein
LRGTNLVLMTATGRLLAGTVKDRNGLAQGLQEVLDAYGKLPEEERRPKAVEGEEKPVSAPPPGGLVLTIYDRVVGRGNDGQYRLIDGREKDGFRTTAPHGQRSSLWLTADECRSLIPQDPKVGETHKVSSRLAKRIWIYGLWPHTLWVVEQTWKPNAVREGELALTVREVSEQSIRLRVHGSVLLAAEGTLIRYPTGKVIKNLENRYDARLEGELVYDRGEKKIVRWNMTGLGDYTGCWFSGNHGWKEAVADAPLQLGFAFELDRSDYEVPAQRRRPPSFVHAHIFKGREAFYWDPEAWEADWKKKNNR